MVLLVLALSQQQSCLWCRLQKFVDDDCHHQFPHPHQQQQQQEQQ
eukprot:CAMPEP_0171780080 /NCGR_PEP_ID=MMETSP0991-20121206/59396_1 /TAXON_ID=483369 /ORGANISM="non described non described, Strain CCMP2098" /LENGTH=44 /DNA_ID= /DNA_START= /DNA_END= /DNA_ORIENTATION=